MEQAHCRASHRKAKQLPWPPKPWMVLAVLAFLAPYEVSLSSTGASFTLVNRTAYFLHAVINNEPIVYIPPGAAITRETSSQYVVVAEVTYSPGQDRSAKVLRTFQTTVHTTQTGSYSSNQSNDCSGSNGTNTCESATNATQTTNTTIDPITWVVTDDTLSTR